MAPLLPPPMSGDNVVANIINILTVDICRCVAVLLK